MKRFDRSALAAEIETALTRSVETGTTKPLPFDATTLHKLAEALAAVARHAADAHDQLMAELQQIIADLDTRIARLEKGRKR